MVKNDVKEHFTCREGATVDRMGLPRRCLC